MGADLPKREVYFDVKELIDNGLIKFRAAGDNVKPSRIPDTILLSDAVDSGATPFTEGTFLTFARTNLGS